MVGENQIRTLSGINIIAGVWLILAPFILGYIGNPRTNDIIVGIVIGLLAVWRVVKPINTAWVSWVNAVLGLWLIIAPFVLFYNNNTALWNDIIVGIIVLIFAIWSALSK